MKQPSHAVLPESGVAVGFQPEFLDFQRGIRVGNLEEHQRITRVLKLALEARYGQPFITERWGRGVYWQWIGYLPRANRTAKPLSAHVSFGCSKFFLTVDREEQLFKCGLQVERGYVRVSRRAHDFELGPDWDWHRLLAALKPRSPMEQELKRLLREGFMVYGGTWEAEPTYFSRANFSGVAKLRRVLQGVSRNSWAGFQVFYPTPESEVRSASGWIWWNPCWRCSAKLRRR